MKILYIAADVNQIGGIEKYNRNLIATLRELEQDVIVVERQHGGLLAKTSFFIRVIFSAATHRPDFVICAHLHFSPICLYLKRFLNFSYSVSVYGIEVINIKKQIFKRALREADTIIYLFNATAENVIRQIPEIEKKLFNLPNSVDGQKFEIKEKSEKLLSRFGLKGSKIILTIGRMSKLDGDNKGYQRVIKAMPKVLEAIPNVKYLLVGSGDDISAVKQLITELKLEKNVVLAEAPTNEEIVDYYNLANVFVLPSKNEGFPPIVLLEALSCGVSVVGGKQKGAKEALLNGELGMLVDPDSIEDISATIIALLGGMLDKRLYDRVLLRHKIIEVFGLQSFSRRTQLLLSLLKGEK
ncbi:MAG: glycosyltransferase family 4 protein [bacterium]|nr:glycosyltransferase family 4 protein [bacterium]